MAIKEKIVNLMSRVMDVPESSISDSSSPFNLESWDSLNHIKLILALEEEFGVKFTDAEIQEILELKSIVAMIEKKHAAQGH